MVAVVVGAAGCSTSPPLAGSASPSPEASVVATDYSQAANWMVVPTATPQRVDVFYLYPTSYVKADASASNVASIDDAHMRAGAQTSYQRQATVFAETANIYAPYYRQLDATYALTLPADQHSAAIAGAPTIDASAAFAYYLEHYNQGRPFILAGHSQGSDVANHLLSGYLKEHEDVYKRMVAAYLIGYSVTPQFLTDNPHLRFATGADDTGVIISYNTQAPTIAAPNPVLLPGAMAINPITWTRGETTAPASASLGSWLPDANGNLHKVAHYADATVDTSKGVIVASTPDESQWSPGKAGGFPAGVYHQYDYSFYYFDLQANARARVEAYLGG